jgi:hypothetical protein
MNISLIYGIITIILINVMFLSIKPQLFFVKHTPKVFGVKHNETILPYHSIALFFGIFIYMISLFN